MNTATETPELIDASDNEVHPSEETVAGPGWLTSWRSFWAASVLLLIVLLGLIPVLDNGHVALPDGGVYAAQAQNLAKGGWSSDRPAPDVDKLGFSSGLRADGGVNGDRELPYARHPLFSVSLVPFFKAGNVGGMMVFSILGVWIASVCSGLLGRRIDPAYGIPTLLLAGVVSPLLFDAYLVSAHGMGAGLVAVVFLGAAQVLDDQRWWPMLWTLPAAALAINLRSEASVVLAATAITIAGVAVVRRLRGKVDWRSLIFASALMGTSIVAYLVDARLTHMVVGESGIGRQPLSRVLSESTGPWGAAWNSLLSPWNGSAVTADPAFVVSVVFVGVAALALRFVPRRALLPIALGFVAAGGTALHLAKAPVLVSGLLPACPLLFAGILLLRRDLLSPLIIRLLALSAVSTAVLIVTVYEVGGAAEWGGRFFHVLIPALAPCSIAGMAAVRRTVSRNEARVLGIIVVVIALFAPIHALRAQNAQRSWHRDAVEDSVAFALRNDAESPKPLLIVGRFAASGHSRIYWNERDRVDVLAARGPGEIMYLVELAKNVGRERVTLATHVDETMLRSMGEGWLENNGWDILASQTGPAGIEYLLGPAVDESE